MIKVSFVVVTYNSESTIDSCVQSLLKQTLKDVEVIVVDNQSADQTRKILSKYQKIRVIHASKNGGFGYGNNLGVENAQGKYVCFVNPDAVVKKDMAERVFEFLETDQTVGIVGFRIENSDGSLQRTCNAFPTFRSLLYERSGFSKLFPNDKGYSEYIYKDWSRNTTREVDAVSGACFAMSKALCMRVGGFDERYFLFYEEFDLSQRVKRRGYRVIFNHGISVKHLGGISTQQVASDKMTRVYLQSQQRYILNYKGRFFYVCLELLGLFFSQASRLKKANQ